ncbi:hypothetical protein PISMIDRAFT_15650 [Pisolithus microcarpus 441]|uniref:Uncharacterized protein n=1 Tax=Pisolithus microcarpus 441 TaxID=765257 RepID=A0A0C9YS40_9AGAM|nr:hypothetical protein PISMIDRAFT_15650 [Pisolithus microcarpus 441]
MSGGSTKVAISVPKDDEDEAELVRMGYKQELKRKLSLLQNFGVSPSIIGIITGIPSLFSYGSNSRGPAVMVWRWIIVSCTTMLVELAMVGMDSAARLAYPKATPFKKYAVHTR